MINNELTSLPLANVDLDVADIPAERKASQRHANQNMVTELARQRIMQTLEKSLKHEVDYIQQFKNEIVKTEYQTNVEKEVDMKRKQQFQRHLQDQIRIKEDNLKMM